MPRASRVTASHLFDRCQRWWSPKWLPRIRGAALGLFRYSPEQLFDRLLEDGDGGKAADRQGRSGADRVDDLGAAVARAQLDGADVVAERQAGEDRVGEAMRPAVGDTFIGER